MRRRLNDFLGRSELRLGLTAGHSWPIEVTIEPTNRCNSRCVMCLSYRHDPSDNAPPMGFMEQSTLERLEPALRRARRALLTGCGEPLLHPRFLEMARWVKARVPYAYLFTNGSRIDDEMAAGLVRTGVDLVSFSLGGATSATADRLRGIPHIEALRGLEHLARAKVQAGSTLPEIQFNVVAMNSVLPELGLLVDLARRHGVKQIAMPPLLAHNPGMEAESILANPEAGELIRKGRALAREAGIELTVWDYPPRPGRCTYPHRNIFVAFNGDVLSCAAERHVMGNVDNEPLRTIWRSEGYRTLRRLLRTDPGTICPGCPDWSGSPGDYLKARPHDRRLAGRLDDVGSRRKRPAGD